MTNDQKYEGDVKLSLCPDECGIQYENGNPIMTGGVDNTILVSLHTKRGWWGNLTRSKESEKYGSDYEDVNDNIITTGTLQRKQDKAINALKWMIDEGISEENTAECTNPQADRIDATIGVKIPINGAEQYEVNWDRQFGE